jgi:hypothetical protein
VRWNDQQLDRLILTLIQGKIDGGVVIMISKETISTMLKEQLDRLVVTLHGCKVEWSVLELWTTHIWLCTVLEKKL